MKVSYSVPYPVVVSGHKAMFYGRPALAFAHNDRTRCTVSPAKKIQQDIIFIKIAQKVIQFLQKKNKKIRKDNYHCLISGQEKVNGEYISGFFAVVTACLLEFFSGSQYPAEIINRLAYSIEKKIYPFRLGLTITCASMGGIIYFRREFMFLTTVSQLPFKIPAPIEKNLYIRLPKKKSTASKNDIDKLFKKNPTVAENLLSREEKETKKLVAAIASENSKMSKDVFEELFMLGNEISAFEERIEYREDRIAAREMIPFKQSIQGLIRE